MKLKLERRFLGKSYTIGTLSIDGNRFCDILEPPVRDIGEDGSGKVMGDTAIPAGTYEVRLTYSNKFKRILPLIVDVPHFRGIRIHRGNTVEDTDGCPLPGENTQVGKVLNSTPYEKRLIECIEKAIERKETIKIEVV